MTDPQTTSDVDARVARLRERAENEPPASWVPEADGEYIAGKLVRYERGTTAFGDQIIAILQAPDGTERAVWLLHAVLHNEFSRQRPRPGELVLIRYVGRRQAASGAPYAAYRVEVDREDAPLDWDAVATPSVPPAPVPAPAAAPRATAPATPSPPPAGPPWPSDDDIPF